MFLNYVSEDIRTLYTDAVGVQKVYNEVAEYLLWAAKFDEEFFRHLFEVNGWVCESGLWKNPSLVRHAALAERARIRSMMADCRTIGDELCSVGAADFPRHSDLVDNGKPDFSMLVELVGLGGSTAVKDWLTSDGPEWNKLFYASGCRPAYMPPDEWTKDLVYNLSFQMQYYVVRKWVLKDKRAPTRRRKLM